MHYITIEAEAVGLSILFTFDGTIVVFNEVNQLMHCNVSK